MITAYRWNVLRLTSGAVSAALALAMAPASNAALPCPADLDCSGAVNVNDLLTLLADWGLSGTPSDLDGSGIVNVNDLLLLLADWGPCMFDFGPPVENDEALQIGLEMLGPGGPLTLAPALYARIDQDLAAIRAHTPALAGQTHSPAWLPNQLIVKVLTALPHTEYECLNVYYQVIEEEFLFSSGGGDWYVLTFAGPANIEALGPIYAAAPEVEFAEPNGLIGGENFWTPTILEAGKWAWDVDDGFLDCFDGCDCHRLYALETSESGGVDLISYQEIGQPWCDFGGR
jgi:hypothetical protein